MNAMWRVVVGVLVVLLWPAMQPTADAGPVGGPIYKMDLVLPRATDVYNVTLRAGETTVITVIGGNHTDLDLFVYDENSNLVGSDDDGTSVCIVSITPRWTGRFTIKVKNLGFEPNLYIMSLE
ncbi:MAG: PPC domain-containing protein [Tepidisphaerales bacterium]